MGEKYKFSFYITKFGLLNGCIVWSPMHDQKSKNKYICSAKISVKCVLPVPITNVLLKVRFHKIKSKGTSLKCVCRNPFDIICAGRMFSSFPFVDPPPPWTAPTGACAFLRDSSNCWCSRKLWGRRQQYKRLGPFCFGLKVGNVRPLRTLDITGRITWKEERIFFPIAILFLLLKMISISSR